MRNNNPGNLIRTSIAWQGKIPHSANTDKNFEQFENVHFGLRAMLKDLINDINKGKNTVKLLITEYAPPSENDTKAYINSVAKTLGVSPTQKLTEINSKFLINLVRAILQVELGKDHTLITDSDIVKSITMLGDVSTPILKVTIDKFALAKQYIIPLLITIGLFFYSYVTITI
ncbi:hypothetical protein HNP37_003988 [Flavobacterium nitrogenifigens]|uniref:Uncharacterized protein n=2 Tax=Flavobacterium TaxID=237 RepID=A0A7W7J120_9FLAO|nr:MULTISPECIES: hypothetical protein [Flavobacterium]MBB4803908.1 hypothetical protein [Flavobacterium nitrogenifigens]MBB6388940.1 hypothetical protein [Flavobacterium notoginsengisoli]